MRVYGNCGVMPHTTFRPTPIATTTTKQPPKATALGADLMRAPGHIAHLGKQRGRPKTEAAPKTCEQCGATFTKPPTLSNANWNKRRYCGRACSNAADAATKKAAAAQQPPCHCGRPCYAKGLCESHYKHQRKAA